MPLKVGTRAGRAGLWIRGTVTPAGKPSVAIWRRAGSDDPRFAREEAASITAEILRNAHHGERRGIRGWAAAVDAYCRHQPRSAGTLALLIRLTQHFRDTPLRDINQAAADRAARVLLRPGAKPATVKRNIIVPMSAVIAHAEWCGWCDAPRLRAPAGQDRRTPCGTPAEFEALRDAIAPQHRDLLTWLIGTGCRRGETWALEWPQIDLQAGVARLWGDTTKTGRSRLVRLPPAVVAMLANRPSKTGPVFGDADPRKALATAARRAGVTIRGVHDLRHWFASWHYALHRDLLALKEAGGWQALALVERYAHLMPTGHEAAIRRVWGVVPGPRHNLRSDHKTQAA